MAPQKIRLDFAGALLRLRRYCADGVTAYDPPPGNGNHEHNARRRRRRQMAMPRRFGRRRITARRSPIGTLGKQGVGLVLEPAGGTATLHQKSITVTTDTPGFTRRDPGGRQPQRAVHRQWPSRTGAQRRRSSSRQRRGLLPRLDHESRPANQVRVDEVTADVAMKSALAPHRLHLLLRSPRGAAPRPTLPFTPFAQTDLPLGQVVWTGDRLPLPGGEPPADRRSCCRRRRGNVQAFCGR